MLTFDHIRHKTAFNNEPYAAWNVKKARQKSQKYGYPLVVRIVEVRSFVILSCAWKTEAICNVKTAVHPTVTV